jgi:uncharacterized damage-inducible protein DinB
MRVRMMVGFLMLGVCTLSAVAQMPAGMKMGPAAGTLVEPSKAVDAQLSGLEREMMGVVNKMPAEKYGSAPSPAIFVAGQTPEFTKVRTFAEQVAHVADANYSFYSAMSGLKPATDVSGVSKLTSKAETVAALAASFAFAHKAIATLTPTNAFESVKMGNGEGGGLQTKTTLATFGVAHGLDHYGQMVEYLRMNGMVPPASQ